MEQKTNRFCAFLPWVLTLAVLGYSYYMAYENFRNPEYTRTKFYESE